MQDSIPVSVNLASGQGKNPHCAKTGNVLLRKSLYMPALTAKRYNPVITAFCDRLIAHGKRPMQVIIIAMRKLLHITYGVLKSGQPFDPEKALA